MDFVFPKEVEQFRLEVREFLQREMTPEIRDEYRHCTDYPHGFNKAISRKLGQKGWLSLTWPKEYGGQGLSVWHRVVFEEEMAAAHAPIAAHQVSANFVGPALLHFASEQHKRRYLPAIAAGEVTWALGWTEANAGSDLAAVETRAVRDGDDWVINGSKLYTEHIQDSEFFWVLARTDPTVEKHRGCSAFVIDLKATDGVHLLPLWTMDGYRINQVFIEDVRVPADALLGELNRGFYHLAATSNTMRSSGLGRWLENQQDMANLVEYTKRTKIDGRPLIEDTSVQYGLADFAIHATIGKLLAYRVASMLENGGPAPDKEASVRRVWDKVFNPQNLRFGLQQMGMAGQIDQASPRYAPLQARFLRRFVNEIGGDHNGGSPEIIMNTVVTRVLNLPR